MFHKFILLFTILFTLTTYVSGQTVIDPGFETPNQTANTFTYQPTDSAWTFLGSSGFTANNSPFTSGNSLAPQGNQVAFLQKTGSISQIVTNWTAGSYLLTFNAAQRGNYATRLQNFQVLIDDSVVSTVTPSSILYESYSTNSFIVTAGSHTLTFQGLNSTGGDNTAFIDNIVVSLSPPVAFIDPGFETPNQTANTFTYQPTDSAWTFLGSSGFTANNSPFTSGNSLAPQGNQVAFLQKTGSISQIVTNWTAGSYLLTFNAAQRNDNQQNFQVLIDDVSLGTFTPSDNKYQIYYALVPSIIAGQHTLTFQGLNSVGGDNTVFIDTIKSISLASVTTPATVSDAWVGSSGKTIGFHFSNLPTQSIIPPTIYCNGLALPPLGPPADLASNEVALFPLPTGIVISVNDIVTATTTPIWQNTTGGLVAPITGITVDNRVGRSSLPSSALIAKTLIPGVNNNNWPSGPWGNYWPFKNWAYKVNWPPGHMNRIKGVGTSRIYANGGYNGVDNTAYPGPAGLWMVYWKSSVGPKGEVPATFSLVTVDAVSTTVSERVDLANPSAPNGYQARVFDFEHTSTSTTANIDVALKFDDPSNIGNYFDLWVVGPGDFDYTSNVPVIFDTSDPFVLSRTYTQWIPQNVGSLRWVDSSNCGGNPVSCPYPELLMVKNDTGWGELSGRTIHFGFSSIGPVDTLATPWQYSPFYRKDTEQFTATLVDSITTTPAIGTNETYTFSDADNAPLMAGLEITIDSEIMRILTVSGSSVKLYRGSNGTTPALHQPGQVKVSGRRPIQIPSSGVQPGAHVYQLTTNSPHGQVTNTMSLNTQGDGWPNVTWTDGSIIDRIDARPPLVTGPNTLVQVVGPFSKDGCKPIQIYPLDPTKCFSQTTYGAYIPPEVTAIATGKFSKAALHVNINPDACDDFVWTLMRRIRDNFPPGRTVIVEYLNEPWNWSFNGFEYCQRASSSLDYETPYFLSYYMRRSGEIGNIARASFKETGRDSEIKLMLNCQVGSDQPKDHLTYAAKNGWQVDRIGNAPYLSIDVGKIAFATWDDDQLCDLWPMFLWYDVRPNSYNAWINTAQKAIADYNKVIGNDGCQLMGYEGGIEFAVPTGSANQVTRGMDLVYNPNWYWMEDTFYRWLQSKGFVNFHVYSLSQYHSPHLWGMYHWPHQKPGYGDGRFGGTDNRLFVARPGQPNTKPPGMNIDMKNSVRGQAFIDRIKQ